MLINFEMAQVEATTQPITEGSSTSTMEDQTAAANDLLANGKKNLQCGDLVRAVDQLQEACKILSTAHGETNDKCAEAYLLYGTALLDLGRKENDVLGNALDGIDENDDDNTSTDSRIEDPEKVTGEEREKISNEVIDAMLDDRKETVKKVEDGAAEVDDKKVTPVNADETPKVNGADETPKVNGADETTKVNGADETPKVDGVKDGETVENSDKQDEVKDEEKQTDDEEDEEEEMEGDEEESEGVESQDEKEPGNLGEGTSKDEEEADEDVSNLQLAWEMLELAKTIFSNRGDGKEMKLKIAECHLRLGEVSLETEQCIVAVEDFTQCLDIQKSHLEEDSRLIAQTQYEIGLAYYQSENYEESKKFLNDARTTITKKIEKLTKKSENKDGGEKEAASAESKEIADLKDILQDIQSKIEEAEEEITNQKKLKALVKENIASDLGSTEIGFGNAATSTESTTAVASDINHLIRKKRKPEGAEENVDESSKKARQEPTSNGTGLSPSKIKDDKMEAKSTAA